MEPGTYPSTAVGIDLVQISRIRASLESFGPRFTARLFTAHEAAYCSEQPESAAERFAVRFAAKEAVIKILRPDDVGLGWRLIEVRRAAAGFCALTLHGAARELAAASGLLAFSLSMSHEGDYATAVVIATQTPRQSAGLEKSRPAGLTTTFWRPPGPPRRQGEPAVILEQVRTIVRAHGRLQSSSPLEDHSDLYKAGMTSQASVNVMLALESAFDIEFPDHMLKRSVFASVAAIGAAIEELLGGRTWQATDQAPNAATP